MTDKELAQKVQDAAWVLARAMTEAGNAGLMIDLEMKPHSGVMDTARVYKRSDYRPILHITRIVDPLAA